MEENKKLVQFIFNENREVVVEQSDSDIKRLIRSYDLWASESEPEKTWYHYASDEQGSTIFITDKDKICNKYDYDAWGNLTTCEEIIPNRYLYTGQQFDQITQQYYLRARYYNPVIARFTQEDIYRGDGLNLYTYCDNNPVIYYDPSGYAACNKLDFKNSIKKNTVQSLDPNNIRFSQSSINGEKILIESMQKNGWNGEPIDVVLMKDNKLTTLDNTRVYSARKVGIDVKANVHEFNERLPEKFIKRFTTKKGVPSTWGEAVKLRIGKQNSSFRKSNPLGAEELYK